MSWSTVIDLIDAHALKDAHPGWITLRCTPKTVNLSQLSATLELDRQNEHQTSKLATLTWPSMYHHMSLSDPVCTITCLYLTHYVRSRLNLTQYVRSHVFVTQLPTGVSVGGHQDCLIFNDLSKFEQMFLWKHHRNFETVVYIWIALHQNFHSFQWLVFKLWAKRVQNTLLWCLEWWSKSSSGLCNKVRTCFFKYFLRYFLKIIWHQIKN